LLAVFNPLLTLGIPVILPPLFGGAAPLSEIMCLLPDFGMAVGVTVVVAFNIFREKFGRYNG